MKTKLLLILSFIFYTLASFIGAASMGWRTRSWKTKKSKKPS